MSEIQLNLLVLKSPHVERLLDFYRALGIEFTEEKHGAGPLHYAANLGEVVLEIYPFTETADSSTRIGFRVEEMELTIAALRSLGVEIVSSPKPTQWGDRAVVRDPDGRAVELITFARPTA